jgi:serine/threonine protein kinase
MISFACPLCGKRLNVKSNLAGKKGKCPGCRKVIPVPASTPSMTQAASPSRRRGPTGRRHSATERDASHVPQPTAEPAIADLPTLAPSGPETALHQNGPLLPDFLVTAGAPRARTVGGHAAWLTDFLAPAQSADEIGRLGPYRVLKVLGRGGMGVVFQAEDTGLLRMVALKAILPSLGISPSIRERFIREARAAAALKHPHVVTVFQVGEECGAPYLAMEYLEGEPLDARLAREGRLPVAEVLRIGREIALGLAAAHAKGLIHRDVKPANVWLEGDARHVKILDFGLARAMTAGAQLTQSGAIMGTPAYMAPEQAAGRQVDGRVDLFSLGCVLYEMSTGERPFKGDDAVAVISALALETPPTPRSLNAEVPAGLSDLISRLLEKEPARRLASADATAEALLDLEKVPIQRPKSRPRTPTWVHPALRSVGRKFRRRWPLWAGTLAILIGLAGLGLVAAALIRVQTEQGDYVIETDDPDFVIAVAKGGVTLEDRQKNRKYNLKVIRQEKGGEEELEVTDTDAELSFHARTFTVKRGEKVALKTWFERKPIAAAAPLTPDDSWLKNVAALPAEKQVEAVAAKLIERNPGFDGKILQSKIEKGAVTELILLADQITNLWPVTALTGLQTLECHGSRDGVGKLTDLSPLKSMKLQNLLFYSTEVSDLRPLEGMDLILLHCGGTKASDLSPVKSLKHLEQLYCGGMKRVSNLSPLRGLNLRVIDCSKTPVSDLSPLNGMPLTWLKCYSTPATDLSPLKDTPLKFLWCDFKAERDADVLRAIKTLQTINDKPAKEFWKTVDAADKH